MSDPNTPQSGDNANPGANGIPTPPSGVPVPPDATVQMSSVPGGPPSPTSYVAVESDQRRRNIILGSAAAAVAAVVVIIILIVALTRGDDDSVAIVGDTTTTTDVLATTIPEAVIVETTIPTETTIVETTIPTETTIVETTLAPTTTLAPVTTLAPATTVAPAVTVAPTPTTIPVVTVPPASATMWDVIVNSPDLSEFRALVEAADLIDVFDGPETITVFVPTNPAIEAFRAGVGNEAILADPAALVRRHVIAEPLRSTDVFTRATLLTLVGDELAVDAAASTVDGSPLVVRDIEVAGSVLHVVDRVLAPPTAV